MLVVSEEYTLDTIYGKNCVSGNIMYCFRAQTLKTTWKQPFFGIVDTIVTLELKVNYIYYLKWCVFFNDLEFNLLIVVISVLKSIIISGKFKHINASVHPIQD